MQGKQFWTQLSPDMVGILREYGFLFVLAAVGILSFFYFRTEDANVLEHSLDAVGAQLMSVVGEAEAHASVAGLYERFKTRVLRKEVTPEQVEQLAANILQLRRSGEQLTAAQAEEVFNIVLGAESDASGLPPSPGSGGSPARDPSGGTTVLEDVLPASSGRESSERSPASAAPSGPPATRRPADPANPPGFEDLGERLKILLELNAVLDRPPPPKGADAPNLGRFVEFHAEDGTRVVVDVRLKEALSKQSPTEIDRLVHRLESSRMLTWTDDVQESRDRHQRTREEAAQRGYELQVLLEQQGQAMQEELARLARYRALQAKGVTFPFDIDSLESVVRHSIEGMVHAGNSPAVSSRHFSPPPDRRAPSDSPR